MASTSSLDAPTPSTTPVQWMHAFAFTPSTASSHKRHTQPADGDEDALPTRFRRREQSPAANGRLRKGNGEGSVSVAPAERKRRRRGTQASPLPTLSATHRSSTVKIQTQIRSTSVMGENEHPYTTRMVLDAVEIVCKKKSRTHVKTIRDECLTPTEGAHRSESSYYPSPPVSRASGGGGSLNFTTDLKDHSRQVQALPLKASKYFSPTHTPPARPPSEPVPTVTPPLAILTYTEYPLDHSSDERENHSFGNPGTVLPQHNNSGLFNDLMVMLRRLKPILIQESVQDDPWKVLIAVRLLNVTTGKAAIPVFCKIISRWPTPQELVHAPQDELVELLRPLGLYNKRANWLKDISENFLGNQQDQSWLETSIAPLLSEECTAPTSVRCPGVGPYALDSLRIFCTRNKDAWKHVMPRDKELVRYLRWRWSVGEGKIWYPEIGVVGNVNVPYLVTLVDELAMHYDNAIGGEGTMSIALGDFWCLLFWEEYFVRRSHNDFERFGFSGGFTMSSSLLVGGVITTKNPEGVELTRSMDVPSSAWPSIRPVVGLATRSRLPSVFVPDHL